MVKRPLLVFDFDGVIVDGMAEYWWSACMACRSLQPAESEISADVVPEAFRLLRPWVHHGWEMVLLAAEMPDLDPTAWQRDYAGHQQRAMLRRGWDAERLQQALDRTRREAVLKDRATWLARHQPYPGVVKRLHALVDEGGVDWAVLTTKSRSFTEELLRSMGLQPWRLDGRESGNKPDVLLRLQQDRPLRAFVEDRRDTLVNVRRTPGLERVTCLLVSWGYLKPSDRSDLPEGIHLLDPQGLAAPLAQWP